MGKKEEAEALREQILRRSSEDIVSGAATGRVRAGWAMGHFYDPRSIAHSPQFEIKEWGPESSASTFNAEWDHHPNNGPEYLRVTQGELRVFFGYLADDGQIGELEPGLVLRQGDTAIVPPGLYRRYEASADVRGITVRASLLQAVVPLKK